MASPEREVFRQTWNWHDPLGSGEYTIGKEQFYQMDASCGRVQNSRLLAAHHLRRTRGPLLRADAEHRRAGRALD